MKIETRTYSRNECVAFCNTRDPFGELTNFHPGFPIDIPTQAGIVNLDSSETFYQACKFMNNPDLQSHLIDTARAHHKPTRGGKDFALAHGSQVPEEWRAGGSITAMRHALRLKLAQYHEVVGNVLNKTGDMPIVELSKKDAFWGAKPEGAYVLRGANVLGRLWMEIRQKRTADPDFFRYRINPPVGANLLGSPIVPWIRPALVLNAHKGGKDVPGAIYVGRPSKWGNPIPLEKGRPRGETLDRYLAYLRSNPKLVEEARMELAGRDLVCWCAPQPCHADILRDVAAGKPIPDRWIENATAASLTLRIRSLSISDSLRNRLVSETLSQTISCNYGDIS